MIRDFDAKKWNGKKIIIYGKGDDGRVIADELRQNSIYDVAFCDSDLERLETGKDVFPDDLCKYQDANIIIGSGKYCLEIYNKVLSVSSELRIFTGLSLHNERVNFLLKSNVHESVNPFSYKKYIKRMEAYFSDGWFIPHLDLVITTCCTLNCKGCASFVPFYKNPKHVSKQVLFESMDKLLSTNCYIGEVCLIGGEPFLNQKLFADVLYRYINEEKIGYFCTYTNGTILPTEELLIALNKNGNCYINFSNYGILSDKIEACIDKFKQNNIPYILFSDKDINDLFWLDYGRFEYQNRSDEENQAVYEACEAVKLCTTLLNGKFSACPFIARGVDLDMLLDLPRNYVELTATSESCATLREKCIDVCYGKEYLPACAYCKRPSRIKIGRAIQE